MEKHALLKSSADSTKYSVSIQAVLVGLIPAIIFFGRLKGIEIAEADLIGLVGAVIAIGSSATLAFGIGRKIYFQYKG